MQIPPPRACSPDGEAWKAHYEAAAPVYRVIAASYPVASPTTGRAVALYRSLATVDPKQTEIATGLEANLVRYAPADAATLTYAGEIWADRERFDRARPLWNAIAASAPGRAEGYLESATIFWDYYQFDEALNQIDQGRKQLGDSALHAYQAGAIYENKRQYDRALAEYATAALKQSNDVAERRLVRLARRPALRDSAERLTANLASGPDATVRAIALRTAVLDNQGRRAELEQFLVSAASRANALEVLEAVENQGRISGFAEVQERAMLRRVEITTDPVDQIRYRLALAHFYRDEGRTPDAGRVLDALLEAHPNTLGVVRAATDFYWRSGEQKRAVTILADAANRAQKPYQGAFRLEAARKATESGDTATARQALALLLKDEPYRAEYLSAMADTYARAGDDRGLRTFYQSTIESLRASSLSPAEKTAQTAAIRRGLIPVLTRVHDYSAALDQYIEILNRYPEDEQVARDAATYAGAHQLSDKLAGYYAKAAADSPRDYRQPMLLGRVCVGLERFPEAIDAYAKATAVRPDRVDLWIAQAEIQERLLRFADAERNYSRVFELTYHNASWMERVATLRARLGQKDGVIAALRTAYIENRPERAENYFAVASKLDAWGYVDDARKFAEKGAEVAGPELTTAQSDSAAVYARVLGRAREYQTAYQRLIANGTEPDAAPALSNGMRALGDAVREYYTPEEKTASAAYLEVQHKPGSRVAIEAITAAGLEDVTVRWLAALARANPGDGDAVAQLAERQRKRMRSGELGAQLEALWKAAPAQVEGRDLLLLRAISAYRDAGDNTSELRVIRLKKERSGPLDPQTTMRFCQLLALRPQSLATVAATDTADDMRDMAANCAIENTRSSDALAAIAARGKGLPPVWTSAYTGLVGLYFSVTTPQIRDAFLEALGSPIIGDRIGKPLDRDRQLAGEPWFYYGARYGEYLDLAHQPNGADYVPAVLEAAPGNAGAYYQLANYYRESGASERALVEYGHTLELDAARGAAHDWTAELLWAAGRHDDALAEWRLALDALNQQQNRHAAPPAFWEDLKSILTHIGKHDVLSALKPDADRVLKTYLKRNGTYQFEPVLEGILAAAGDPAKGVAWLEELSRSAGDPLQALAWAVRHDSVPDAQRDVIYQKLIDAQQAKLASSFGEVREGAEAMLRTWQFDWLRSLAARRETARAQKLLNSIPEKARRERQAESVRVELQIAAQAGTIPALLAQYAAAREGPPIEDLRNGASELRKNAETRAASAVLEFVYSHELEAHHFDAANFLGLAEIRLEQNQAPAAVDLLRRMTMLSMAMPSGEPFENHLAAAALLDRFGKTAESLVFVEQRAKAVPWDVAARERLAEARKSAQELAGLVNDKFAPYANRSDAAKALRHAGGAATASGSAELDLLASTGSLAEQAVNKPYWYPARIEASAATKDTAAKIRILLGAIATWPDPPAPRLDLFRAALDQKRYATAIAAMPEQPESWMENLPEGEQFPEWMASSFLQGTPYGIADRAFVAAGLGEACQRLNEPARSAYYYRLALDLDRSAAARAAIGPKLDLMVEAMTLRKTNAERRPVVSRNLDQPHIVRPKVTVAERRAR